MLPPHSSFPRAKNVSDGLEGGTNLLWDASCLLQLHHADQTLCVPRASAQRVTRQWLGSFRLSEAFWGYWTLEPRHPVTIDIWLYLRLEGSLGQQLCSSGIYLLMTNTSIIFYLCQELHMALTRKEKHKNLKSRIELSSGIIHPSKNQGCSATCRCYKTYQRVPQQNSWCPNQGWVMTVEHFTQPPNRLQFSISWCHLHPFTGSKDEEECRLFRIMFGVSSVLRWGSLEGSIGTQAQVRPRVCSTGQLQHSRSTGSSTFVYWHWCYKILVVWSTQLPRRVIIVCTELPPLPISNLRYLWTSHWVFHNQPRKIYSGQATCETLSLVENCSDYAGVRKMVYNVLEQQWDNLWAFCSRAFGPKGGLRWSPALSFCTSLTIVDLLCIPDGSQLQQLNSRTNLISIIFVSIYIYIYSCIRLIICIQTLLCFLSDMNW